MSQYSDEVSKLLESGAKSYASKEFEDAVSNYGEACQIYSNDNEGKESPDLLFLYGKALFQVAVSKNGIFGGNPDEAAALTSKDDVKEDTPKGLFQFSEDVPLAEEEDEEDEEEDKEQNNEEEEEENNDDQDQEQEQEPQEEQSDFEIAWEILDLSRSLYEQSLPENHKLQSIPEDAEASKDPIIITKIKLSDIHDLLGEISLETENFKQASEDFESLLTIREELFPFESELISEAHYKLSLALEFNFNDSESKIKAINHLTKAIESIKLKQSNQKNEDKDLDLIKELESRLDDLQKDPNEAFDQQKNDIIKGILGEVTSTDSKQNSSSTSSTNNQPINDLTSIVKKRKSKPGQIANDKNKKSKK
ncbi:hypothetical protein BN7_2852 [Wickerhamomyces ciferrii]|uniref:Tetratricopeptide SHNi-TPR domain-containing protein n=1 Tax=Wickerhamomyces ciferrii (strain ATCC 14091 / BCRC 22168 / CBS 111 / JCM 3599 / NBRC 0793 / NRRL Y-1031 F-60-10) TaxID=1206466 RepID=K0KPL0_WICCF|nr:uncharacterized protein BN7_2852 [Wickerhamomyces ciferrii]CCH43304.1 hypothetical protein BN7_2852 [Wickerhamomyces ciferrii]